MTVYSPNPVVTIDGLDSSLVANAVDVKIQINYGRETILEQAAPSYARLDVYMDQNVALDIRIGQQVTVTLNKSVTGTQTIFTGTISDIDAQLYKSGVEGGLVRYSLTALGPLSQLHRYSAGSAGYAKEFDGTRIKNILTEAFLTNWDEVSPTLTWEAVPEDVTWETFDGANNDVVAALDTSIDTPGNYELMVYADGATDALTLAQTAANSGLGLLWDAADGSIHYFDADHRQTSATTIYLGAADIVSSDLEFSSGIGEMVNDVEVTYRAGSEYARDDQSVILYGQLSGTRSTVLHNSTDAQTQAQIFSTTRSYPRQNPKTMTFELSSDQMADSTRNALLGVGCDLRIQTDSLPVAFGTSFDGFVENWTWNLSRNMATLTVGCSTYSENYPELTWLQVPANYTWTSYGVAYPTQKWSDL